MNNQQQHSTKRFWGAKACFSGLQDGTTITALYTSWLSLGRSHARGARMSVGECPFSNCRETPCSSLLLQPNAWFPAGSGTSCFRYKSKKKPCNQYYSDACSCALVPELITVHVKSVRLKHEWASSLRHVLVGTFALYIIAILTKHALNVSINRGKLWFWPSTKYTGIWKLGCYYNLQRTKTHWLSADVASECCGMHLGQSSAVVYKDDGIGPQPPLSPTMSFNWSQ